MVVAQPASAAISCDAATVTFSAGGVSNGSPCGNIDSTNAPETFEVIFDKVTNLNGISADFFDPTKYFSLQATSIKTPTGGATIGFQNIEFFVTGGTLVDPTQFNDVSIAVWQAAPGVDSQGFSNYSVANPVTNGFGTDYKTASFDLAPIVGTGIGGLNGGFINTKGFRPSDFGVQVISNLRIKGTITGGSASNAAAAFGLAYFNTDPTMSMVAPSGIAGRAVDVNKVPGPLPIFGAGAAFGMSRKLRRRIASKKAVA